MDLNHETLIPLRRKSSDVRAALSAELVLSAMGWLVITLTLSIQFWAEEFTGDADWDDGWFEASVIVGVLLGCALLSFAPSLRRALPGRLMPRPEGDRWRQSIETPNALSPWTTTRRLRLAATNSSDAIRTAAFSGKRLAVILPALNAAKTLQQTYDEIPHDIVDDIILTDDGSTDNTAELARSLGIHTLRHERTRGYGGNQKSCYAAALDRDADIVVMLHPDYQYSPLLLTAMASMIASGHYDVVLGSRILGDSALRGGMPVYKYVSNRALTLVQNLLIGKKLSEYHTGYRAWSRAVLETLPLLECSDDFVFDNEMLTQAHYFGFRIGEISCPTAYFADASSINFRRSVAYGIGVLRTSLAYRLHRIGVVRSRLFTLDCEARLSNSAADRTPVTQ